MFLRPIAAVWSLDLAGHECPFSARHGCPSQHRPSAFAVGLSIENRPACLTVTLLGDRWPTDTSSGNRLSGLPFRSAARHGIGAVRAPVLGRHCTARTQLVLHRIVQSKVLRPGRARGRRPLLDAERAQQIGTRVRALCRWRGVETRRCSRGGSAEERSG